MKNLIKIFTICSILMVSCNKDDENVSKMETAEYKEIELNFLVSQLEEFQQSGEIKKIENSNFILDGYTIQITGNIHPKHKIFSNIDVSDGIKVMANGNIQISIIHPDFDAIEVTTNAYLGLEDFSLEVDEFDVNYVELACVQGSLNISASIGLDDVIKEVRVLGKPSFLDETYYTASEMVDIEVVTNNKGYKVEYANILGEGYQFQMKSLEDGLEAIGYLN